MRGLELGVRPSPRGESGRRPDEAADASALPEQRVVQASSREMRRVRIVATALSILLAWLILTRSIAAYLADADPALALWLSPGDSVALLSVVDTRLNGRSRDVVGASRGRQGDAAPAGAAGLPLTSSEISGLKAMVERVLDSEPLSALGVRLLGQLTSLEGDEAKADRLMQVAARMSLHESVAVYWLFLKGAEAKDYARVIHYGDILLRTRPDTARLVVPVLTRIAEDRDGGRLVKEAVKRNPPWREAFLSGMLAAITDARTPLDILLALKDGPTPPAANDLRAYLEFLIVRGYDELAYFTWLQFLRPDQLGVAGHLFNGDFSFRPADLPFDWTVRSGLGARAEIVARADSGAEPNPALRVQFGTGRVDFGDVSQRLVLAPARYTLSFSYRGDIASRRGMRWVLTCTQGAKPLLEADQFIGLQRTWRTVETAFEVPASGCRAQTLRLVHDSRSASEQFISGEVWYDDLSIVRAQP